MIRIPPLLMVVILIVLASAGVVAAVLSTPGSNNDSTFKTIFVDDDFDDDPSNHSWDSIQDGVDDASDGDTVVVYAGVYVENVVVQVIDPDWSGGGRNGD
ncbi:MAG: hypothetical protein U9N46_08420 [Euryarchaeota archaeon]|nr:MAG: hypothetical protein C5S47_06215 [ANME-2 cluster archaeon]MEA1865201.1 hypothetical protein [Euryarchaeota archaeon]